MTIPLPVEIRFWSRVTVTTRHACWPWHGGRNKAGYGQFWIDGRFEGAHRVAFFLVNGRWPEPQALHRCDNPECTNPYHVIEGTQLENVHDMMVKGRARFPVKNTECSQGHPFSGDNLYIDVAGKQRCRACISRRKKAYYQRRHQS